MVILVKIKDAVRVEGLEWLGEDLRLVRPLKKAKIRERSSTKRKVFRKKKGAHKCHLMLNEWEQHS